MLVGRTGRCQAICDGWRDCLTRTVAWDCIYGGFMAQQRTVLGAVGSRRAAVWALALTLLLACTPGTDTETTDRATGDGAPEPLRAEANAEWDRSCGDLNLQEQLLALAGPDGGNTVIYDVDLCPFSIRRRSTERTSLVTSDGRHTFVTTSADGPARLYKLSEHDRGPVPGLGSPRSFDAHVSDGRLAYVRLDEQDLEHEEVRVWDLSERKDEEVYDSDVPLGLVALGPRRQVATFELSKRYGGSKAISRLVLIQDGHTKRLDVGVRDAVYVLWSRDDIVVSPLGGSSTQAVAVDAATGEVAAELPPGWAALAPSPDGDFVLADNGGAVALFSHGRWRDPLPVGRIDGGRLWQATWPESAPGAE